MAENIEDMTVREAWHPYQRECGFLSQAKVEGIEQKFRENLDTKRTFWIKTQLLKDDDPEEDDIAEYEMHIPLNSSIGQIKKDIRVQEGAEEDEKFSLIYRGEPLSEDKNLSDYMELLDKEMKKWPFPYCGVLWISYEHFESKKTKQDHYFVDDSAAKNLLQQYQDV
jgi:hypothetical protein|eukprot:Stramenopile-MAST_4_protein_1756